MQLGKFRKLLVREWQQIVLYAVLLAAAGGALWYKLGTLTGGYSAAELHTAQAATSWQHIFHNPLDAPFLVLLRVLAYINDHSLFLARVVAMGCGLLTVGLFYGLVRYWHGERTALFGTILFATSAWFLHTARIGTPDVLLFGLLALVACYIWLKRTSSGLALLLSFILVAALLYVPGMVWFIVLGIVAQWRTVDRQFKKNLWAVTAGGVLLVAALVPLGLAIYHDPQIAKVYAGLPAHGWPMPLDVLKNLLQVPVQLFLHGPATPEHWLGKVPVLDYFTATMFFLGGYLYVRHAKLGRFWLFAGILIIGTVLVSLGGAVGLSIIVPIIYMIAASGVGFMLDRWLTVFPRNVIAQGVGIGLISAAVLATSIYSLRHYFVAWPSAPPTKAIFTVPDTAVSVTIKK
ncbi:MAG TPA: glycosyltransferase family 39 protein [Patescibacteria group bacterium]|nr:glycosyltransferase family 39 protein [Patescibacteria group bacterium]